jgi:hypothetical protein
VNGSGIEHNAVLGKVRAELLRAARERAQRPRSRRRAVVALIAVALLLGASAASAITRKGPLGTVLPASKASLALPRHPVPARTGADCAELRDVADRRAEPTVRHVDRRLRELLGVLRRPQGSGEALSSCGIELEDGENLGLGRVVVLPGGEVAYIWPARDAVCYGVAGIGGCPGIEPLERDGVTIGGGYNHDTPRGMMRLSGVARDGVRELVFTPSDGRSVTAPVVDNLFTALVPMSTVAAERVDDDGRQHALADVPDGCSMAYPAGTKGANGCAARP